MHKNRKAPYNIEFRAGTSSYTNVNFALSYAQKLANKQNLPVTVYQTLNGKDTFEICTVKPEQ